MREEVFAKYFEKTERLTILHKFVLLCLFTSVIPQGAINFTPVFVFHLPKHRCAVPAVDSVHEGTTFNDTLLQFYIPPSKKGVELAKCERYTNQTIAAYNSNHSIELGDRQTEPCTDGWEYYDEYRKETAAVEFDLVCDDQWKRPFLTFAYSFGALISAVSAGTISDRFGRRKSTLGSLALFTLVVFFYSLGTNYWMCLVGFMLYGLIASATYSMVFVHVQELVKTNHRDVASCFISICLSTGYMSMPLIAYLCTSWRWIIRIPGFLSLIFASLYFFVPESPHWLFSKGKLREATQVLKRLMPDHDAEETLENLADAEQDDITYEVKSSQASEKVVKTENKSFGKSMLLLFRNRIMLKRTLVLCWMWAVSFVVYFTFGYNTSNLGGNIYWNSFLSAGAEVPGWILGLFFLKKIGRRFSLAGAFGLSSFCGVLCPMFEKYHSLSVAVAMIGKIFSSSTQGMIYLYTAELFPTTLRSTGVGITNASARVACLFAPFLAYSGETSGKWIPFYVMSGMSILAAVLTLLLPETKNIPLPEDMNDALALETYRLRVNCPCSSSRRDGTLRV